MPLCSKRSKAATARLCSTCPVPSAPHGDGPAPGFVKNLDDLVAARDLLRHRRKYFIGVLDPCASIEFSRGCPWDCSFCSAWTFYGRSYRVKSAEAAAEELATDPRARRLHRRRRRLHPGPARHGDRRSHRPPRNQEAVLSRDSRRRARCETRMSFVSGKSSVFNICSWASRPSTKTGSSGSASE